MKPANELIVHSRPGESIRSFIDRFKDVTAQNSIYSNHFAICYYNGPIHVAHIDSRWNWRTLHDWLKENVGEDHYIWFGHDFYFEDADTLKRFKEHELIFVLS